MPDPRIAAVAKVLVEYSVEVNPGQLVYINANVEGRPLVVAL